jgi:hypothetical protein
MQMSNSSLWARLKVVFFAAFIFSLAGCAFDGRPSVRMGTLPTPPPGPRFSDPSNLGPHRYGGSFLESNGIVYCSQCGHIDITHVRWNADWTRYCALQIQKSLINDKKGFNFNLAMESSTHEISFTYPANWTSLSKPEKQKIAEEISYEVGPYIAFNATLWHEIITFFGTHFAFIEPEFNSAFTWEDMYSNLLGTKVAVAAMKDKTKSYNAAMTQEIYNAIRDLGVQPRKVALDASRKMRNKWYTGIVAVETFKKNMDYGHDDGYVSPVLVPGMSCNCTPKPLAVPTTDILKKYGFTMKHAIHPHEWERGKIFKVAYNGNPDGATRIDPVIHFPILMDYIKKTSVDKYKYIVDDPDPIRN